MWVFKAQNNSFMQKKRGFFFLKSCVQFAKFVQFLYDMSHTYGHCYLLVHFNPIAKKEKIKKNILTPLYIKMWLKVPKSRIVLSYYRLFKKSSKILYTKLPRFVFGQKVKMMIHSEIKQTLPHEFSSPKRQVTIIILEIVQHRVAGR